MEHQRNGIFDLEINDDQAHAWQSLIDNHEKKYGPINKDKRSKEECLKWIKEYGDLLPRESLRQSGRMSRNGQIYLANLLLRARELTKFGKQALNKTLFYE